MIKPPFFSVVIPALNEAEYLPKLLNALNEEAFKDFEVIVVDGGSTDETQARAKKFIDLLTLSFYQNRAQNVGEQRNFGAQKARGEYLVFFDADTIPQADYLDQIQKKLTSNKIDFATTRFVPLEGKLIDSLLFYLENIIMFLANFLKKPFMSGTNLIFRHEVFNILGGFDKGVIHGEDVELVQRAVKNGFTGIYFWSITHRVSLRRYRKEGRFRATCKYFKSAWHILIHGPIRKPIFEYQMGGENFKKK